MDIRLWGRIIPVLSSPLLIVDRALEELQWVLDRAARPVLVRPGGRARSQRFTVIRLRGIRPALAGLGQAVKGEVGQCSVSGGADAVFAAALATPQFEVGNGPQLVLVANTFSRSPLRSVDRSCAPGCVRSLRTMTRIAGGHTLLDGKLNSRGRQWRRAPPS